LRICNFESHKESFFKFSPGINVLIGDSDSGKSAVMRALRWVCYNEPSGDDFVRIDNEYVNQLSSKTNKNFVCSVELKLSNGYKIERAKTRGNGGVNRYVVTNPEDVSIELNGFGVGVPEEVKSVLGFDKISFGNRNIEMNYLPQLNSPLALEFQGAGLSSLLNRINGVEYFEDVLKNLNRKVHPKGELVTEEKIIKQRIDELEIEFSETEDSSRAIEFLSKDISPKISILKNKELSINDASNLLGRAIKIKQKETLIKEELDLNKEILKNSKIISEIEKDAQNLESAIYIINKLSLIEDKQNKIDVFLEKNERIAGIDVSEIQSLIDLIKEARTIFSKSNIVDKKIKDNKNSLQLESENRDRLIEEQHNFIIELIKKFGKCPTCEQELDEISVQNVMKKI